jgi:phosphoglycolate phosphatase
MTNADWSCVRALIFDLDGTLIDSKQDLIHSVNAMMRELGRKELAEKTVASYIGHGAPQLVARALGENCPDAERQRGFEFFMKYYEEHDLDRTRAYPGVAETLQKLAALPQAVLTNKPVRMSVQILEALGLAKFFHVVYGGDSFETKKPDPLGAHTILGELGVPASAALMIGDSGVDVQTARNAGMLAAFANYGFGVYDRAADPADIYLEAMTDLAGKLPNIRS